MGRTTSQIGGSLHTRADGLVLPPSGPFSHRGANPRSAPFARKALDRLAATGIPLDGEALLHAATLRRIEGHVDKADWPSLLRDVADGRLYTKWTVRGATPRIYADAVVHGVPKTHIRDAFRSPGSLIVTCDWSASHFRLLADLSGDQRLAADLVSGGLYTSVAADLGLDASDPSDIKAAKVAALASLNGQGVRARWDTLPFAAHRLDDVMARRWPVAMRWLTDLKVQAQANGGIVTTPSGTRVVVPDDKLYAVGGYYLQAVEADALLRALVALHKLEDDGYPLRAVALVHDEVVVECHDPSRITLVAALVQDAMTTALTVQPSLRTGATTVAWGPSWGQQDGSVGKPRALPALPQDVALPAMPTPDVPWAGLDEGVAAGRVVDAAREKSAELRARWWTPYGARRGRGCQTRSLHATSKTKFVSWGMRCRKSDCWWCGPWQAALTIEAIMQMPLVANDEVVGRPMGQRGLFIYRTEKHNLPNYLRKWREETQNIRIASIEPSPYRRDADVFEEHAYVVVDLGGDQVVILTTVPKVYKRSSGPQPVVALDPRITIESIVQEALAPRTGADGVLAVPGSIKSSSNNLTLDTRKLVPKSHVGEYTRLDGPLGAQPAEVARRLRKMVDAHDASAVHTGTNAEGLVEQVTAPTDTLDGDRRWLAEALAGRIDDGEIEYRIEQYNRTRPGSR